MQELLFELTVGETLLIDDFKVKIVAVDGEHICFEICDEGQNDAGEVVPAYESGLVAI